MRGYDYGILGEDEAHKVFIENFFKNLKSELSFELNYKFNSNIQIKKSIGSDSLIKQIKSLSGLAFSYYEISLLIVVTDADTIDQKVISEKETTIKNLINPFTEKSSKKFLICIPVKSIEHWLWYIKVSSSNVNYAHQLESQDNKTAKETIYNNKKYYSKKHKKEIENLTKNFSIHHLRNSSQSFSKFYQSVEDLIQELEITSNTT